MVKKELHLLKALNFEPIVNQSKIGLTPLIALIYTSVEPAVTQNCVASVTNKNLLKSANNLL